MVSNPLSAMKQEMTKEDLRKEIVEYEQIISTEERKLFGLLQKAEQVGELLDEEEMKRYGL